MEEEEIKMPEKEQADDAGKEGESSADSSPIKPGRGRPLGLKKLKVCVTDFRLMGLVSGISNGGSTQPKRGRGRPKLSITTKTEEEKEREEEEEEEKEEGSGDDQAPDSVPAHRGRGRPKGTKTIKADDTPRKRGRPKKSFSNNTSSSEKLPNGDSESPKRKRGRPKGSVKRVSESAKEDEGTPVKRKRGRPKGSTKKKSRRQREESSEEEETETEEEDTDGSESESSPTERVGRQIRSTGSNGISDRPQRQRGRPRKSRATDDSPEFTRGIGRPKGSLNKKSPALKEQESPSRYKRPHNRPLRLSSSPPAKRGRPRKYPLPTAEERNKPKEWKPLGRPRKYPRADPPEGATAGAPAGPRRGRGRPPKTQSKKGAHLRKRIPAASSPSNPDDDPPRKSRQALSAATKEAVVPRKRGRPKGPGNKNKASEDTELDRASPTGDLPPVEDHEAEEEEHEAEPAEEEEQTTSPEHVGDTEEKLVDDPPRKSRQTLSAAKNEAVVPRKRGRPKGPGNKNKARQETELDRASPTGDLPPVEDHEAELAEEEEQTTSPEHVGDTEEKLVDDPPRKSRQALPAAKKEAVVPRKRGRPKGPGNKNKAREETELDRASPNGDPEPPKKKRGRPKGSVKRVTESAEENEGSPVEEHEAEPAEEEEHEAAPAEEEEPEPEEQTTSPELVGDSEEKLVEQNAVFEVIDQA
ncbi:uncharacterized protein si:ch211-288g17.3 [Limanda limanda]|uniref:uncharacterized protein si:ch211-288g17.3 n=1 Tax=Limanda limanda TaxID=27771 RepID=UPI0029C93D09|nr:uncharacterized protein si:ch211-288g17.3 [Limanda limanda]